MRNRKQTTGWRKMLGAAAVAAMVAVPASGYPIRPLYQDGQASQAGTEGVGGHVGGVDTPESFFDANVDPIRPRWNVANGPRSVTLSSGLGGGQSGRVTTIVVPGERYYVQQRRRSIVAPLLAGAGTYLGLSDLFKSKSSRRRATQGQGAGSSLVVQAGTAGGVTPFAEPTEWKITFLQTGQGIDADGDGQVDVPPTNDGNNQPGDTGPSDESFTDLRQGDPVNDPGQGDGGSAGGAGDANGQPGATGDGGGLTEELIASDESPNGAGNDPMGDVANQNALTPTDGGDEFALEPTAASTGGIARADAPGSPEPMTAGLAMLALAGLGAWTGRRRARA